jgi:hypothetical protein
MLNREPVAIVKGLVGPLLMILVALGLPIDQDATQAALLGVIPAVAGVVAAFKVRHIDKPTVAAAGLIGGLAAGIEAFGFHLSDEVTAAVTVLTVQAVSLFFRDRVTPEAPPKPV